jgi:hypothetical protein
LDTSTTVSLGEVSDKDDFSSEACFEDSREFIRYDASKIQKTLKEVRENSKRPVLMTPFWKLSLLSPTAVLWS